LRVSLGGHQEGAEQQVDFERVLNVDLLLPEIKRDVHQVRQVRYCWNLVGVDTDDFDRCEDMFEQPRCPSVYVHAFKELSLFKLLFVLWLLVLVSWWAFVLLNFDSVTMSLVLVGITELELDVLDVDFVS
jgi:hypothetical protein